MIQFEEEHDDSEVRVYELELPGPSDPYLILSEKDGAKVIYGPFRSKDTADKFAATLAVAEVIPHESTPEAMRDGWLFDQEAIGMFGAWFTLSLLSLCTAIGSQEFFTKEMPQEIKDWTKEHGIEALAKKSADIVKTRVQGIILLGLEDLTQKLIAFSKEHFTKKEKGTSARPAEKDETE